jgi:3-oxoacyl-(acyl-carrier-protein) synthase
MSADVFITGMGIVSGIGNNVPETLESLKAMRSGIGKIKYLNTIHDLPCAEVQYSEAEMNSFKPPADAVITRTTYAIVVLRRLCKTPISFDGGTGSLY